MGTQPTLHEKSERVGIRETRPYAGVMDYLHVPSRKGKPSTTCRPTVPNTN